MKAICAKKGVEIFEVNHNRPFSFYILFIALRNENV